MPYKNKENLPEQVKRNLPEHAQEIYLKAFNSAWEQYKESKERREMNQVNKYPIKLHGPQLNRTLKHETYKKTSFFVTSKFIIFEKFLVRQNPQKPNVFGNYETNHANFQFAASKFKEF